MDFKKYLADFKNWTKEDFRKAREKDVTTLEDLTSRNAWLRLVLETDLEHYRGGQFSGSYRAYEASYQEQRAYLEKACEELPEDMKQEAREAFAALCPVEENRYTYRRADFPGTAGTDRPMAGGCRRKRGHFTSGKGRPCMD